MKIYILSFNGKKNWVPKTHWWRNGDLREWGRNRPNWPLSPPGHPLRWKGVFLVDFGRFRPHFDQMPFFCFWVFGTNFFFILELRIKNKIKQKNPRKCHFSPNYSGLTKLFKKSPKIGIFCDLPSFLANAIFLFFIFFCWDLKSNWRLIQISIL